MDPAGAGALAGLRRPRPSLRFVLLLAGADAGSSSLFLIRKDSGRSFLHTSTWVQKGLSKLTRGSADLPISLNKIPQQTGNDRLRAIRRRHPTTTTHEQACPDDGWIRSGR